MRHPARGRSVARQVVLGPAAPPPIADLRATRTVGTRALGDVGALIWVAEQLDLVGQIDRACGRLGARDGPSVGELAVAVAIQRACAPGPKRDLGEFLDTSVARLSCLPGSVFSGQAFHRVAQRVNKALAREHLSSFVVTTISGTEKAPALQWRVDAALRRKRETTRLGRRVLCTDRHNWSTGRIVHAFRGQWNVEEMFRRAKKGGVVPWGTSHQWADGSLRLHTFATVVGLMLVSLAKIALGRKIKEYPLIRHPPCVYFLCLDDEVVYVGRTVDLVTRIAVHEQDKSKLFDRVLFLPTAENELDHDESRFIALLKPPYNRRGFRGEVSALECADAHRGLDCAISNGLDGNARGDFNVSGSE